MTEKLRGTKRLAKLYGVVEQIRSLQLRVASTELQDVSQASRAQAELVSAHAAQSHAALLAGDIQSLAVAKLENKMAETRQLFLQDLVVMRQSVHREADRVHGLSRQRMKQIESVVEQVEVLATIQEGRRAQATSDDRFLARRTWMQTVASEIIPTKRVE